MNPIKPYTHNLFTTHDSLDDALAYAQQIASGCGTQSAHVMTAVMGVINTASKDVESDRTRLLSVLSDLVYYCEESRLHTANFHQALARAQALILEESASYPNSNIKQKEL